MNDLDSKPTPNKDATPIAPGTESETRSESETESETSTGKRSASTRPPMAVAAGAGVAVAAGAGVAGAMAFVRRLQQQTLFAPDRFPGGVWNPEPMGLRVEDVWFRSEDGVELHGWWRHREDALGTVLFCHGNSGSLGRQVPILRLFDRLGVNLFAFDYRGYGRSAGQPSEPGVFADVRAAFDHLVGPLGARPEQVLLFGHSLGGAIAIDGAVHRPAAGLVVQNSFTDVKQMARALYPRAPMHWVAKNGFRSIDKVGSLAMPTLFIHGTKDVTVPVDMGRRLFEAASDPKEYFEVAGGGHNNVYRRGGQAYLERIRTFAARCFAQTAA